MNEQVSVSLQQKDIHQACAKCGMESKQGCCHDEVSIIKLIDSHSVAHSNINFKAPEFFSISSWAQPSVERFLSIQSVYHQHPPPLLLSKIDSQALMCVFRI